jgi:DNA-binding MarR family transcriptional regulator
VLHGRGATRFHVLVSQTLIEPPTLSRYLKDLKSMGYVTRTSSSVDARGVLITPTKKALDLVEKLTPHAFQVEQETLAGLTEDEAEIFRRLVKRVCNHLAPFAADEEGRD